MLEFYVIGAKSDPSFLTKWTLFLIFTCSSLESSFVDFTEVIKRFQLKSVSVINSQLFWWTNYSVMWCCIFTSLFWWRIASTCILFTAFHLLLLVGSLLWIIFFCSNLLSPSCNVGPKWEKTCYFGKYLKFFTQHWRHSVAKSQNQTFYPSRLFNSPKLEHRAYSSRFLLEFLHTASYCNLP